MSNVKNIHKRVLSNSSWLIGDKTLSSIFTALQTILVARILGVDRYGLLVLVITYIDLLNQLIEFRVWETAIKYIGTFWEKGDTDRARSMIKLSYLIDVLSGILAFAIAILTASLISVHIIRSPEAYSYILIYSLSLLFSTLGRTSIAILRVFNEFRSIAIIRSSQYLIRLILVAAFLLLGYGIKGVLYGLVIASIIGFILRISVVLKTLNANNLGDFWKSRISLIREHFRGIAWFIGNTNIAATIRMGEERYLGIMILGYVAGKDAVAFYKIAMSAGKIISYITVPLYEAIYPEFIKLKSQNIEEDMNNLIKKITVTFLIIGVPLALIIIIFSASIIELTVGASYLPSAEALRVIAVAAVIDGLTFWINPVLLASEKPGLRTMLGLVSTLFYLIFLLILAPAYSFMGAAYAYLAFVIIRTALSFIILRSPRFGLNKT